jgi:hypothetical protein
MRFSARVLLSIALLVGASLLTGFQSDRVVARVGGDTVSLGELRHWMDRLSEQAAVSDPVKEAQAIADRAMALIIDHRLLKQEAKANGVPDVTEEDFHKAFSPALMTMPNLSDRSTQEAWVADVLRERLVEKLMTTVKVSQGEIEQRFEASRKDFQPEMAAIRWIVVESEETGRTVIERLQQGEAFGQLAKTVSIEPVSAKKGGAVGAVRPDKIPAELSVVVFAKDAKLGLIERPIEVIKAIPFYGPPGWYVVAIDELVRQGETTLANWRPVVETMVRKEKAVKALEDNLARRRKKTKIWVEKDLAALVVPVSQPAEAPQALPDEASPKP